MFKELAIAVALSTSIPVFATDIQHIIQKLELNTEEEIGVNIGAGFANMLLSRFEEALVDFNRAEELLADIEADVSQPTAVIEYAKVITYDCLNKRPECERALGRFILAAASVEDDSDDEDSADDKEIDEFMAKLTDLAPSEDVRKFLMSINGESND